MQNIKKLKYTRLFNFYLEKEELKLNGFGIAKTKEQAQTEDRVHRLHLLIDNLKELTKVDRDFLKIISAAQQAKAADNYSEHDLSKYHLYTIKQYKNLLSHYIEQEKAGLLSKVTIEKQLRLTKLQTLLDHFRAMDKIDSHLENIPLIAAKRPDLQQALFT